MPASTEVDGVAINISQNGAFISTTSWSAFQNNDQTEIELLLPAEFTGQEDALLLRGQATVKRVERDRWGTLGFLQSTAFRQIASPLD
jgi:hypothetical protein